MRRVAVEPQLQRVGRPGGYTGAEKVVVAGPDSRPEDKGTGDEWPVVRVPQGAGARLLLEWTQHGGIDDGGVGLDSGQAQPSQLVGFRLRDRVPPRERQHATRQFVLHLAPRLLSEELVEPSITEPVTTASAQQLGDQYAGVDDQALYPRRRQELPTSGTSSSSSIPVRSVSVSSRRPSRPSAS